LLTHGRWFSPGTPASSTTKTGRHDIAEILVKVALSTINEINHSSFRFKVTFHVFTYSDMQATAFLLVVFLIPHFDF
jgi:hypothetical protein